MNNLVNEKALLKFTELMTKKIEQVSNDPQKSWFTTVGHGLPQNIDGRFYNGVNSFMLFLLQEENNYKTPVYMTFAQAKAEGLHINKGASAFPVLFWNFLVKDNAGNKITMDEYKALSKEEQIKYTVIPYTKPYMVFNVDQTNFAEIYPDRWESLQEKFYIPELKDEKGMLSCPELDHMIKHDSWLCPIVSSLSDNAFFRPSEDKIYLPLKSQFYTGEVFYSTLLHEMAHSTGIESRLGRELKNHFGDPKYAKEELIAELTSAVTSHALGIVAGIQEDNAQYLKNWLEAIEEEPNFLFSVLTDVGKASTMILEEASKQELNMSIPTKMDVPTETEVGFSPLSKENGQFCHVERTYREDGSFSFTGKEKIKGTEDVAYIFKQLEDYSIENAFAVLVNKGKPTIIHLGMGSLSQTQVDLASLKLAFDSFGADQIYFVHNHPSGNLKCSAQDMGILNKLKKMFPDKIQDGIIINTLSGKYGVFAPNGMVDTFSRPQKQEEYPLKLYSFSKMVFAPDYDPATLMQVRSNEDVAALVSSARLGTRQKISYLILNIQNQIVANIHTPFKTLDKHENELADEMVSNAFKFTGNKIILYGDFNYDIKSAKEIERDIDCKSNREIVIENYVIIPGLYNIQMEHMFKTSLESASIGNYQPFMLLKEQGFIPSKADIETMRSLLDKDALTTIGFIFQIQMNPNINIELTEREKNNNYTQLSLNF